LEQWAGYWTAACPAGSSVQPIGYGVSFFDYTILIGYERNSFVFNTRKFG